MATLHGLSVDGVIALSDGELARLTYEYIGGIRGANDDDDCKDALYFLVTETFERFAPEVERAEVERDFRQHYPNAEDFELEFGAALDGIRRRQATRMIRDAFREGGADDA